MTAPILEFQRFQFGSRRQAGWCFVRVYQHATRTIVVITEPITENGDYANEGLSTTNGMEDLKRVIDNTLHACQMTADVYIHHLPPRGSKNRMGQYMWAEEFAEVTFNHPLLFGETQWRFLEREDVEALIGTVFTDYAVGAAYELP
jgi:hypothetical protein